jgi:uncharacterized membrane protein
MIEPAGDILENSVSLLFIILLYGTFLLSYGIFHFLWNIPIGYYCPVSLGFIHI